MELNKNSTLSIFDEGCIYRIDHFLGKRPVDNMLVFRFANAFAESFWNRHYIESVQITLAENFGVQGRGAFLRRDGNHSRRRPEPSFSSALQSGDGASCPVRRRIPAR